MHYCADASVSKHPHAHILQVPKPEASASKQLAEQARGMDGWVPRGESTPRVKRSTAGPAIGVVGFVGMDLLRLEAATRTHTAKNAGYLGFEAVAAADGNGERRLRAGCAGGVDTEGKAVDGGFGVRADRVGGHRFSFELACIECEPLNIAAQALRSGINTEFACRCIALTTVASCRPPPRSL